MTTGILTRGRLAFTSSLSFERRTSRTRTLEGALRFNGALNPRVARQKVIGLNGGVNFRGSITPLVRSTYYGGFRDFAHYAEGMLDPAMVAVDDWVSGAAFDGTAPSNMRRVWLRAFAPREYRVSGGQLLWPRAAFMSTGVRIDALANGEWAYVDGGQVETSALSSSGPTDYAPARSLQVVVKADQMNYVSNPQTPAVLASTAYQSRPVPTVTGAHYAAAVDVSGPAGSIVEAYLLDGANLIASSGAVRIPPSGEILRLPVPSLLPAGDDSVDFRCWNKSSTGSVTFSNPRVDRVTGTGPLPDDRYFDGSDGIDYLWGGAANNSPSYYYRDRAARAYLLRKILRENVPLGVTPGEPQFAVLPTE